MKALDYLYTQKAEIEKIDIGRLKTGLLQEAVKDLVEVTEAISELEELMKPKSCYNCKHWIGQVCRVFEINIGTTSDFYCNRYEPKEEA